MIMCGCHGVVRFLDGEIKTVPTWIECFQWTTLFCHLQTKIPKCLFLLNPLEPREYPIALAVSRCETGCDSKKNLFQLLGFSRDRLESGDADGQESEHVQSKSHKAQ